MTMLSSIKKNAFIAVVVITLSPFVAVHVYADCYDDDDHHSSSCNSDDDDRNTDARIKYTDIVKTTDSGVNYERAESARNAIFKEIQTLDSIPLSIGVTVPLKPHGEPGVAILDVDQDGDEDIFVTNGPGVANSLYVNQWKEKGSLTFIDRGTSSGLGAVNQDSGGVCYGDIDNDGDEDVLVLGTCEENQLFENIGDGKFKNITKNTELSGVKQCSSGCSFGDIDADGLLDVVIANTYGDWDSWDGVAAVLWDKNQHNKLYKNMGNNNFIDVSSTSGIENTGGFLPEYNGNPTLTWAIALVDYDTDGDLDLIHADDQGPLLNAEDGGIDRAYIHIFQNDGHGYFTNVTKDAGTDISRAWLGLSFGDLNCDGNMDFFATGGGDYIVTGLSRTWGSRWFLGNGQGGFIDSSDGDTYVTSVYGWGTSMLDYDNDGDLDIVYQGGTEFIFSKDASNPGAFLKNINCSGRMEIDTTVRSDTDHQRRNVQGLATGDLNNDGFSDIVSVANFDVPKDIPITPRGISFDSTPNIYNSPFDGAGMTTIFDMLPSGDLRWTGRDYLNGSLSIEINNGANDNNHIKVTLLGTKSITDGGSVNRDGIGSVVYLTPKNGKTSMKPVVGGASHVSQDSLDLIFGLGEDETAQVEILWPGGLRNKFSNIKKGNILIPEIPCDYNAEWETKDAYKHCIKVSLSELHSGKYISKEQKNNLLESAMKAYKKND